jgi:hypothetical protein
MKRTMLIGSSLWVLLAISCQRDPVESNEPKAAEQVLGNWKLKRFVDEYYHPVNTKTGTEEYTGLAEDSVVFKDDHTVIDYTQGRAEEYEYELIDDHTLKMEYETYKIRKLTATEFEFYSDETDDPADERDIHTAYLYR